MSPHAVPFFVRDDETALVYDFSYLEVVTEGFRGSRIGEWVRFLIDPDRSGGAVDVVRLDLPDVDEYYR
ncbi:hypothetical protein [Nocardia sp. NPDC049149]|uniref:hypothetical protein n=1 Tax=Nocardia sp. NPDC049149 TaxID=3364315 RepID=UPI0037131226